MSFFSDYLNDRLPPAHPDAFKSADIKPANYDEDYYTIEVDKKEDENKMMETEAEASSTVKEEVDSFLSDSKFTGGMMEISDFDGSDINSTICKQITVPKVFSLYRFNVYKKKDLPIDHFKSRILTTIKLNSVVIIHGPTGCGKTTQVPQFILDECKENSLPCNIIVTQPRRIAATSIAQRICEERGWGLGTVCGFQIGLDKNINEDTVLTYVTTEILLQKLIYQKNLNRYTHIIIDEVHERSKTLDFLLFLVRKYLNTNSCGVKVILMSATMETNEFAYYFRNFLRATCENALAPVLYVNHKSQYTTSIFYLNNLTNLLSRNDDSDLYNFDINKPGISNDLFKSCSNLIKKFDKIDEEDPFTKEKKIGSVLVFLPGINEIEELQRILQSTENVKWEIILMHSSMPKDSLGKAFDKPQEGFRKIILATNIAESSITVPDIYYVVDFCLTKNMNLNHESNFSSLTMEWASYSNCLQRAGRVGRVSNGRVYRLVPSDFYKTQLKAHSIPEIQRSPLENIILYVKMLNLNDTPKSILLLTLSPPNLKDVENCIWHLKEIGGLLTTSSGIKTNDDGDLTFLGRIMATLPIDVHLSKLIILGHMFGCLQEAIIMASGCMITNLFTKPLTSQLDSYKKKILFSDNSKSDLILLIYLYKVWQTNKNEGVYSTATQEYNWCRINCINYKGLKEWNNLINEISLRLKRFMIDVDKYGQSNDLNDIDKSIILKIIICGAFYPNYFVRNNKIDMQNAVKILNDRDPLKTVYFTNMKPYHPGHIYLRQIKNKLNLDDFIQVGFDKGSSSKIFIECKDIPNQYTIEINGMKQIHNFSSTIPVKVYELLKRVQLRMPLKLKTLPDSDAWQFVESCKETKPDDENISDINCFSSINYDPLPTLDIQYISVILTEVIDVSHFYCQNYDEETTALINKLDFILNNPSLKLELVPLTDIEIQKKNYFARFNDDGKFYRCKVEFVSTKHRGKINLGIKFIDYGNTQVILSDELYKLPNNPELKVPDIAMCCSLSELKPSQYHNPEGIWNKNVNRFFCEETQHRILHAKIYSVVDKQVHLELFSGHDNNLKSINNLLIERKYADYCEESFRSKQNHEVRLTFSKSENISDNSILKISDNSVIENYNDFKEPDINNCSETITLRGPYSPLEIRLTHLMNSANMEITIDSNSVNSVFLDDQPDDPFKRLVVSGHILQTPTIRKLKLCQTTVLPAIPGFPMIMSLIFCPTAVFKMNSDADRIGGILCGLGLREDGKTPCFPDHDLYIDLDIELNIQIVQAINKVRYFMNNGIKLMTNIFDKINYPNEIIQIRNKLKTEILGIIFNIKKTYMEPISIKYGQYWDRSDCKVEILKTSYTNQFEDIWPLLNFVKIGLNADKNRIIKNNLDKMSQMARKDISESPIFCLLCDVELTDVIDVRCHLISENHKSKLDNWKNN